MLGPIPPPLSPMGAQVVPDYTDETTIIEATAADEEERKSRTAAEIDKRREREEAFLTKKRKHTGGDGGAAAWRPAKRFRKSALKWASIVDHQIRVSTCFSGFVGFHVPEDELERLPWDKWPLISVSVDQGSPEMSAVNFLQQAARINIDDVSDFAHGCHRDLSLALKRIGAWPHVLLQLATWNIPHGPWSEDVRHREVVACYKSLFEQHPRPESSPLFMSLLPHLIHEAGERSTAAEDHTVDRFWNMLQVFNPFAVKGAKTNLNRFLSYLGQGSIEADLHTSRLFGYLSCCLEQDYLGNSKLTRLICQKKSKFQSGPSRTTNASRTNEMDAALANAAVNQLAVGTLVLLDKGVQLRERAIQRTAAPLMDWFSDFSRKVRSVAEGQQWASEQLRGGFVKHCASFFRVLQRPVDLAWIGLTLPSGIPAAGKEHLQHIGLEQNDCAAEMATLALTLVGLRIVRCAYLLCGFSFRSVLWMSRDAQELRAESKRFRAAVELDRAAAENIECPGVASLYESSQFRLLPVQQLLQGMQSCDFSPAESPPLQALLQGKHHRLLGTEIVENAFNKQKRMKAKDVNRRMDLRRAWRVLLDRHLVDGVFKHQLVVFDGHCPTRGRALDADVQEPGLKNCSVDLRNLSSMRAKTDWYSPGAGKHAVKYLTDHVLRYAKEHGLWGSVQNIWLGCAFRASHKLVVREIGNRSKVFFALTDVPGSCCIGWPAKQAKLPRQASGAPACWIPAECPDLDDVFLTVLDWGRYEAQSVEWRSPAWQFANLKGPGSWCHEVRAFDIGGGWAPLRVVAARACFWQLPVTTLKLIAEHEGFELPAHAPLFNVLETLVAGILKCEGQELLSILHLRMSMMQCQTSCETTDLLLELDEGVNALDVDEVKELQASKKALAAERSDCEVFRTSFRARAKSTSSSGGAGAGQRRGKTSAASGPRFGTFPPIPPGMMTQAQAKGFLPEGASIWRGLNTGAWHCHCPPAKRRSFSWSVYGENEAAMMCIRHCWTLVLERHGLSQTDCPIAGLFDSSDGVVEASGSGRSSAPGGQNVS